MNKLSVLKILQDTTVDGPGFRTSVYGAGCLHHCPGCHNPESWQIHNGHWMDLDDILLVIKENFLAQVSFSGGDPFFQVAGFTELARRIKRETDKNIWCYTGYTLEKIRRSTQLSAMLPYIDVLVDGRFVERKKDQNLLFRGSSNQRMIDIPKTLSTGRTVIWENDF